MQPQEVDEALGPAREKLSRLLELTAGKRTLLAQTHDYPDPDTIAAALGLTWVMHELAGVEGTIGYGGVIGRAENRAMIRVLNIRLRKTSAGDVERYDLVALLDTQPEVGNHSIPPGHMPDIVVDHHFPRDLSGPTPAYFDVGGGFGTTSTKVTELVRASGITPPKEVATALLYGLKSDTLNLARVTTPADLAAYLYLLPLADTKMLSEIEHPQVPVDYFRVFNKAIERGKIYGATIVADLGQVYTPDLCAELADRLLQVEGIKNALATGWFEGALFLSFRTRSRTKNSGKILHAIVAKSGLGGAGGHGPMAGARIPMDGRSPRARADVRRRVIREILSAFGEDPRHFRRLVCRGRDEDECGPSRPSPTRRPGPAEEPRDGRSDGSDRPKKTRSVPPPPAAQSRTREPRLARERRDGAEEDGEARSPRARAGLARAEVSP